ncbi:LacI family DNA-binding transcriptional regulator [Siculibacillus lacustris]|uniref:LacI family DNA-binding transcriptional regulator n=1 Tax=Siculibacillus lacustris TaxID=1549641 RepID=A0A4Q9VN40_9HYPH|nr:LacI family DNA-binding transcriptional regulator [Siculibacillus lacustris]TBW37060.1 LacI family DNA-binding transcriptional regulator [Siculibacillus lacustris]
MDREIPKLAKKIKLADVAEAVGVSAITVSRVLRKPELVSESVRLRVTEAVARLGYVPDPAARALASARTDVLGVLIPSVTNNVFSSVLRGIYNRVEGLPFNIQLGNTRYSVLEEERLLDVFLRQRPSGLIVSGIDQSARSKALLRQADCPIVQIMEIGDDPVDMMVGLSHRDAAGAAIRHLQARGYRRIAFLGARMDPRTRSRLVGYEQVMKEIGLLDERLIVTTPRASTVTLGCELLIELLSRTTEVDAVFCNNDDLAIGVLFECQRRRISVPDDFGICGFNDLEMMAVANPPLTSVRTNREEMGRRAIEMLIARIAGEPIDEPVVDLGFEIVARHSTAGLRPREARRRP